YVRRTMVRVQCTWWRRKWRGEVPHAEVPDAELSGGRAAAGLAVEEREALRAALLALPLGQRQVVVLRHVEDRSVAEVAALLGVTEGAVKSQSSRGLARLRVLLTPHEEVRHVR
ncbi:MAG: sigma-70 family RNA polymerase sigma factor, partial [Phycicoccus sp.]